MLSSALPTEWLPEPLYVEGSGMPPFPPHKPVGQEITRFWAGFKVYVEGIVLCNRLIIVQRDSV